jgi:MFS family permease
MTDTNLSGSIRSGADPEAVKAGLSPRRLAAASMVGTALEWFEFTLYNAMAALVFNQLFFPQFDPIAGTILAFSTYAVGYLSRPFGGFIFGRLGDRVGRREVLMWTLILMGGCTFAMGLLPTYETIGIWGSLLLVTLRFIQGVALGANGPERCYLPQSRRPSAIAVSKRPGRKLARCWASSPAWLHSPFSPPSFRKAALSNGAGASPFSPAW